MIFGLIVTGILIWACNKTTTLPAYTPSTIFTVNSKMTHSKDSISNAGDTVIFSVQGNIKDTTWTYPISATLRSTDTTGALNVINTVYFKKLSPAYDTVGLGSSGLFHWKASLSVPMPALSSKTGIKTTATFAFGLNLSSAIKNLVGTDSKFIYVK